MKKALLWGAAICALFVLLGCPEEPTEDPPEPFKLRVTGIPTEKFMGASLVDKDDISISTAVGVPGSGGTFTFYYSQLKSNGKYTYDRNKPFNKSGEYYLALAEINKDTWEEIEEEIYFYQTDDEKVLVRFPVSTSFSWPTDFAKKEQE